MIADGEKVFWIERVSVDGGHSTVVARVKHAENQTWVAAVNILSMNISIRPEVPGLACILHDSTLPCAVPTMNLEDIVGSKERLQTPSALSGSVWLSSRATNHSRVAFPKFLMSHHLKQGNLTNRHQYKTCTRGESDSAILT